MHYLPYSKLNMHQLGRGKSMNSTNISRTAIRHTFSFLCVASEGFLHTVWNFLCMFSMRYRTLRRSFCSYWEWVFASTLRNIIRAFWVRLWAANKVYADQFPSKAERIIDIIIGVLLMPKNSEINLPRARKTDITIDHWTKCSESSSLVLV